jgi:hypothetical protein
MRSVPLRWNTADIPYSFGNRGHAIFSGSQSVRRLIPIDKLFGLVKEHPEWHVNDGLHFNE